MKKTTILLLISIFGIISCNKNKKEVSENIVELDAKTEIGQINDFLKQYEEPTQNFTVLANESTQVRGKQGTIIFINPDDLETEKGESLGKNIKIELKELLSQEQLLRTNAQTISDGKLLVSGGAYFINMTSDGKQLRLKKGKSLSVEFPKISSSEMYLFYGEKDSLGKMNWKKTNQKFENKPNQKSRPAESHIVMEETEDPQFDTLITNLKRSSPLTIKEKKAIKEQSENDKFAVNLYRVIKINQLGWINCDLFNNNPNTTNLEYTFDKKDSIVSANVYLVFKDINSLMFSEYFSFNDKEYNSGFKNIPLGSKVKLIVISIKNGKTFIYKSDMIIKSNETIQIKLIETNKNQVNKLFQL